ncbi:truncated hemoglobin [Desertibaculum subflavum]|uniref:truncated hemoglobin n=1 Tax=Desertibaculum subflavum TaxID=2268458 RepID=UPI000E6620D3
MAQTLYERLGGMDAIRPLVAAFYGRVTASPALSRYFTRTDMMSLAEHQAIFVAGATGGPFGFDDTTLWHAHAALRITREEFEEVVEHLRLTLVEFSVGAAEIEQILGAVRSKAALIVIDAGAPPPR